MFFANKDNRYRPIIAVQPRFPAKTYAFQFLGLQERIDGPHTEMMKALAKWRPDTLA
jgi:hypothetical protein